MHGITFKKLIFRNFMSYGDIDNVVEFHPGLIYLSAPNGYGKSSIVEALTYVLYGKSYRGGNQSDLKNTENKNADMVVTLDFDVDTGTGKHEYHIERRMKAKSLKTSFTIWVDGQEQLKRAGMSQQDFENRVLGPSLLLYQTTIAQNSQETIPLLEMPADKMRKLIENTISLSTEKWKNANNKVLSDSNMQFDIAKNSVDRIKADITYTNTMIETLKAKKHEQIDDLKKQVADLESKTPELVLAAEATKKVQDETERRVKAYNDAQSELRTVMAKANDMSSCLTLFADIEKEKQNVDTLTAQFNEVSAKAESYKIQEIQAALNAEIAKKNGLTNKINLLNAAIASNNQRIQSYDAKMKDVTAKATSVKPGVPCPTCGKPSTEADVEHVKEAYREQWRSLRSEQSVIIKENEEKQKELAELAMQDSNDMLDKHIAELNATIQEYNNYMATVYGQVNGQLSSAKTRLANLTNKAYRFGNDIQKIQNDIGELTKRQADLTNLINLNSTAVTESNDAREKYYKASSALQENTSQIVMLRNTIQKEESSNDDKALKDSEAHLAELQTELDNVTASITNFSDKIAICKYISYMCSDDGLKSYVIKMFVPFFNQAIESNLRRFNLPYHIVFDKSMDYKFESIYGAAPCYEMLSQGQKRKVSFAIAMAFCDFVFRVANFKINCLFLDEILDVSTDDVSLREMVELVRTRTNQTPTIFAVTHREAIIQDLFDYKLDIENNGLFSMLGECKDLKERNKLE
ncbi:MAG: AAA family ATPase [Prevotella sp.]|nr:AAA family ATPase [Prevotella sp.]